MSVLSFTILVWLGGLAAGLLGALTGLGGGVVIVPLLTLFFGVDIRYALGASLISVIATSSGAASAYVREGYSNIRIGMFLEIATTLGAIAGASLTTILPPGIIAVIFGCVLLLSSYLSSRRPRDNPDCVPDRLTAWFRMESTYPTPEGEKPYHVRNVAGGFGLMSVAGLLSGLLGIGSGALKVLAMDLIMCLPFKVSTTTSNFMIGVTAAASAGIYLGNGYVEPALAMPVVLGVLPGSMLGSRILGGASVRVLRLIFTLTILALGIEMIYNGLSGGFK
ncbi:MAG: sulfite exporter TauE/SafE family protein [Actinobacteria bacterium]|nr:sulfite exporter TauE/SafE family protein [Actinomycetota bacterium]